MCGRFVVTSPTIELVTLFDVQFVAEDLPKPSWNIAPTQSVALVVDSVSREHSDAEAVRRLEAARWGLVPSWAKDPSIGSKAFNARIETAAEKPMFRSAVASHRAIVPANGYFEWRTTDGVKIPEYIFSADGEPLALAGLYSWWRGRTGSSPASSEWLLSTTILTRASTGEMASVHDRMPVFLERSLIDDWLDPALRGTAGLLDAAANSAVVVATGLRHHEVDRAVGAVRNNSPELIEPVASQEPAAG